MYARVIYYYVAVCECGEMCAIGHLLWVQMKLNISVFVALRLVDDYYKRAFLCPSGNRSVHLIPYYILKNYMPLMVALITTIFCGRFVVCLCVCCVCVLCHRNWLQHIWKKKSIKYACFVFAFEQQRNTFQIYTFDCHQSILINP